MTRIYKIQKIGRSYYLALPKMLVTDNMLNNGVLIIVRHFNATTIIMEVVEAGAIREYIKNHTQSREDA